MPGQNMRWAEFDDQPDLIPGMRHALGIGISFFQHMDHRLILIENRRQKASIAVLPGDRFPIVQRINSTGWPCPEHNFNLICILAADVNTMFGILTALTASMPKAVTTGQLMESSGGSMRNKNPEGVFRPFEGLNRLIQKKAVPLKSAPGQKIPAAVDHSTDKIDDTELFEREMADVTPLDHKKSVERTARCPSSTGAAAGAEPDPSEQLVRLIRNGEGFEVASTPEYIDGVGFQVHPAVSEYLHKGRFAVQAYIDLHGMNAVQAGEAFDAFVRESIASGKRMVLIVHGRGLSSPAEPVLKSKVYRWLTSGQWRKWVLAFSSARSCDGGAGATYVLLRQRPLTKRYRKKKVRSNRPY